MVGFTGDFFLTPNVTADMNFLNYEKHNVFKVVKIVPGQYDNIETLEKSIQKAGGIIPIRNNQTVNVVQVERDFNYIFITTFSYKRWCQDLTELVLER